MIRKLEDINDHLLDAQESYLKAKTKLKTTEAELYLEPGIDWEREIGKAKPTIKDKEMWIRTQIDYLYDEVDEQLLKYEHFKRLYEIAIMEADLNGRQTSEITQRKCRFTRA